MEKFIKSIFAVILIIIVILTCHSIFNKNTNFKSSNNNEPFLQQEIIDKNSIKYTGWLQTQGSQLQNEKGEPIQLRGLSSHGIQWFYDIITYDNLQTLKNEWNINVFRISMYTDPNKSGYISNPDKIKKRAYNIIEMAIDLDMYVIIDWHILDDNNPQTYETQSKSFFDELSKKYNTTPNIIYEICNEPNGNDVDWNNNVKPYAENIISTIRSNSPKSLVIVGTPNWCKDLENPANNPLNYENVLYSCHFYAGTHNENLQSQIDYCLNKNLPVFISECGITNATGSGDIYEENFRNWITYINNKNLSWLYWSFSNKDEASSILTPNYAIINNENDNYLEDASFLENAIVLDPNKNINNTNLQDSNIKYINPDINDYLTEAGLIIKQILLSY